MTIEEEVKEWIDRVSVTRHDLSFLPACPFARAAWLHNDVQVDDWRDAPAAYPPSVAMLKRMLHWPLGKRVAVLVFHHMGADELTRQVDVAGGTGEFIILPDHPDMPEIIPGFDTSFGKPCAVIQKRDEFRRARYGLKQHGYYANWSESALAAVGATR